MDKQQLEELYRAQDGVREVLKKYRVELNWDYDGMSLDPLEGGLGIQWGDKRGDKTLYQKSLEDLQETLQNHLKKIERGEPVWDRVPGKDPKSYRPEGLTREDVQGWLDQVRQELSSES